MHKITRSQAIKTFLLAKTHVDVANLYNIDMECQVNVAQDGGTRVEDQYKGRQWHGWTDGIQTWKSFRIPYNANSNPEYEDKIMSFDLAAHVEGIGMTGWDWKNLCSRWVAFDFDSITNHSPSSATSLSDAELLEIVQRASDIEWVTVRRSASGRGIHLYVFLDPVIQTNNHNEHAALARSIIGMMTAITGYNFSVKVDVCGGNMWVWHRKMEGTNGLELLKTGLPLSDVPKNWKDHVKVIARKTTRIKESDPTKSDFEKVFDDLTSQQNKQKLEEEHRRLISYIQNQNKYVWWWDVDNNMLVTHTCLLKEAHKELGLKGFFDTVSKGTDPNTQNCFCFPLSGGSWCVRRFTPGIQEAGSWEQDGNGWTRCYYNREPNLKTASRSFEGIEHEKGGFIFQHAEMAMKAAESMGINIQIPNWAAMRNTKMKPHKDGRLIVEIKREPTDLADNMRGWLPEKDVWKRIYNSHVNMTAEPETPNYDNIVRHLVTSDGDDQGWMVFSDGTWRSEPISHVRVALKSMGFTISDVDNILGASIFKCWKVVNLPFQPEYPGDRQWNMNAAQYRFLPSQNIDNLNYPTWLKILKHCGKGLDDAIKSSRWAQDNGIVTGADYLMCWIASLFQEPTEPLPYLFLFGPQNSGKSILHEALSLLLTKGYQRADNCLSAKTDFNGELEGAIICVVEETDLNKNRIAYNRIKDWVTSKHINIRHLYRSPYHIINTTHWIHCANDASACPVFSGDTRITMIFVDNLDEGELIPKKYMIPMLEKEAGDFLAAILNLEIPKTHDRLNIPVIATCDKEIIQNQNKTSLEIFLEDHCFYVPGEMISVSDFYNKFVEWLDPSEVYEWSKIRIGRELPSQYPKGRRLYDGHYYIGNISWEDIAPTKSKIVVKNNKLFHVENTNE